MPPPVFVYDHDCGFCTWWAAVFDRHTDARVVGFTDLDETLRARLPQDYASCSHVISRDEVRSCGASIEEMLLRTEPGEYLRPVVARLGRLGAYRWLREAAYQLGASNRTFWGRLVSRPPPARRPGGEN